MLMKIIIRQIASKLVTLEYLITHIFLIFSFLLLSSLYVTYPWKNRNQRMESGEQSGLHGNQHSIIGETRASKLAFINI